MATRCGSILAQIFPSFPSVYQRIHDKKNYSVCCYSTRSNDWVSTSTRASLNYWFFPQPLDLTSVRRSHTEQRMLTVVVATTALRGGKCSAAPERMTCAQRRRSRREWLCVYGGKTWVGFSPNAILLKSRRTLFRLCESFSSSLDDIAPTRTSVMSVASPHISFYTPKCSGFLSHICVIQLYAPHQNAWLDPKIDYSSASRPDQLFKLE